MTVPVPCAVMPPFKGTVTGQRWSNRPHSASTKAETILNQVVPIIRRIAVAQPSVEDHVGVCPRAGFAEGCFVVHPGVDDRLGDRCHWVGAWKVRRARPSTNGSGSASQLGVMLLAVASWILSPPWFRIVLAFVDTEWGLFDHPCPVTVPLQGGITGQGTGTEIGSA